MIPATSYQIIYISIVGILTILTLLSLQAKPKKAFAAALILCITCSLLIGFRPIHGIFIDMLNYSQYYNIIYGDFFSFNLSSENLIFDNFFSFLASLKIDISLFFFLIAFIYFGGIYISSVKIFPYNSALAFLIYLAAFSTFSYGTNGIKAGAAASLFLVALAYTDRKVVAFTFLALSLGFHHSMILPITAYFCVQIYRKPAIYISFWCLCFVISFLNIQALQIFLGELLGANADGYLTNNESLSSNSTIKGFRIDFILYSIMPILVGCYFILYRKIFDDLYLRLWCIYTLVNSIWLLCMYAEFTNRIAYLSWFIYPVVLIYPFLKFNYSPKRISHLKTAAFLHFSFTLFMIVIYYGI